MRSKISDLDKQKTILKVVLVAKVVLFHYSDIAKHFLKLVKRLILIDCQQLFFISDIKLCCFNEIGRKELYYAVL